MFKDDILTKELRSKEESFALLSVNRKEVSRVVTATCDNLKKIVIRRFDDSVFFSLQK